MNKDNSILTRNDESRLSYERAISYFIEAINEQIRIEELRGNVIDINLFLLKVILKINLYTFFIQASYQDLSLEIFQNTKIRDFILDLTDRFLIRISSDADAWDCLFESIEKGYLCSHALIEEEHNLMPESIYLAIKITKSAGPNESEIITVLKNNSWLLTVLLLKLYYLKTQYFVSTETALERTESSQ